MTKDTDIKETIVNSMILYSFRVMSYPIDIALFSKMSPLLMSNLIRANMIMAEIWIVIQRHLVFACGRPYD